MSVKGLVYILGFLLSVIRLELLFTSTLQVAGLRKLTVFIAYFAPPSTLMIYMLLSFWFYFWIACMNELTVFFLAFMKKRALRSEHE
jgi:hypothetical protein